MKANVNYLQTLANIPILTTEKTNKKWETNEQIKLFLNKLHLRSVIKDLFKWKLSSFKAFESLWTAATVREKMFKHMQPYKTKVYSKLNNTVQLRKGKTTTVCLKIPPSKKNIPPRNQGGKIALHVS